MSSRDFRGANIRSPPPTCGRPRWFLSISGLNLTMEFERGEKGKKNGEQPKEIINGERTGNIIWRGAGKQIIVRSPSSNLLWNGPTTISTGFQCYVKNDIDVGWGRNNS